ncbi:alpha/beta fold hydrolase [Streptomyces sp. SCUT-3]|uniref:alpha/beta fold hydrolase n=1 Tax=Streptomyces TaxID=1883 RepID=UPI0015F7AA2D|nr:MULTISPECIES: alpha/beta hydrolase [unclassified Streptomyces]MCZ2526534.1 alpha/beta hydrolase [Streptomyces sp. HB2AG]QMV20813.1 alpha/beta fold hydrolase [Streptomyces sp. SCUT-3]
MRHEVLSVPVEGGGLAVHRWAGAPGAPVVVALHGLTANGLSWAPVAAALDGAVTLLAPDLRGRACSSSLPGPYGLAAHARDVSALVKWAGGVPLVLAGHSMGAFVAAVTAARHPDAARSVVLVDGGLPVPVPRGQDAEGMSEALVGPAVRRLSAEFASREQYRGFWRAHPAFDGYWSDAVEEYLQHDLAGEEPRLRSSCAEEAVRADGADVMLGSEAAGAAGRLVCPAELLWAPRGFMDQPGGLYDEEYLRAVSGDFPAAARLVPDTNHYSILTGEQGARAVARRLLARAL